MVYFQILIYKFLDRLWTLIGKTSLLFRPNRAIHLNDIDEIVINRADRLGDAVISRPFFESFITYLRSEGWQGRVSILSSSLNHQMLSSLEELPGVSVTIVSSMERYQYTRSVLRTLILCLRSLWLFRGRIFGRTRSRVAFVDLVDSVNEMMIGEFTQYTDAYWMSSNRGIFSMLFDSIESERFAGSAKTQLVDAQIIAFSRFFSLPNLGVWTRDRIDNFYPLYPRTIPKNILLFVGAKEFRNFEVIVWSRLIREFAIVFPEQSIHILDADEFAVVKSLQTEADWPLNVEFITVRPGLSELSQFASQYLWVMGIDGGGINMMRSHTNSVTMFTFGNHFVWGPYLAGAGTVNHRYGDWEITLTRLSNGRIAGCIWKNSFWLPSFQIPFKRSFVSDFPVREFVAKVRKNC